MILLEACLSKIYGYFILHFQFGLKSVGLDLGLASFVARLLL